MNFLKIVRDYIVDHTVRPMLMGIIHKEPKLFNLVKNDKVKQIQRLLKEHPAEWREVENYYLESPLHIAVRMGNYNVLKVLLEGSRPVFREMCDEMDSSPLHFAAEQHDMKALKLLLERSNPYYLETKDGCGRSALDIISKEGEVSELIQLLEELPIAVLRRREVINTMFRKLISLFSQQKYEEMGMKLFQKIIGNENDWRRIMPFCQKEDHIVSKEVLVHYIVKLWVIGCCNWLSAMDMKGFWCPDSIVKDLARWLI
eukprot:TRINITY_DN11475_c0_g1_i1.p1 TRINITY_DN11475_c0_g1~~TRINITY_DN11475_c0_g1_i1.p1  ORF type:complete len:258 (+),score=14.74 TRINITY_DN11475_c0_g1_i1:174-947(+)